jgi:gamma-glutamylcyclotransferase (GGCT)/AIG2-like uncharacterized protein YtfP
MRLAVYGTLKKGESNHLRLLPGEEPLYRGFVAIPYRMYENDEYPMLVPDGERHRIWVEVFDLPAAKIRELDALEEPYDYRRNAIDVEGLGAVEIYAHHAPAPPGFALVESGEWKSRRASSRPEPDTRR